MQLSLKPLVLFALPLLPAATALPATAAAASEIDTNTLVNITASDVGTRAAERCRVNSRMRDLWVENGMTRFRTVFSASVIDPGTYCQYWHRFSCGLNIQCGWDAGVDGGWWRVDASFVRGAGGDARYWECLDSTRLSWQKDYECMTG
ncbi:hypothetical protein QBC34DRAFT_474318 [Podospora aff. communis PSN243]|uniref:Uncharacterized protein n=1 Tax=Podospora aff. communis PSN243 TaxID=3040156 RepID=A0AAV9G9J1_9PEZI|nr:hypothetical protein QBC34DRAFT_474318 [Podospora aff. communis PSN243]